MARTITPFKIRTELVGDVAKHTAAYKTAEGDVTKYTNHLTKEGKRAAKAFDGAQAGAKFGKDFGMSAVASIAGSFNVATLGSIIGTAVGPGIGTAIGSAIGGGIDTALSKVTPIVLNTIDRGMQLNKLMEETRLEFKTFAGSEKEANKYLDELLQISKDLGILPRTVIDTSEKLFDLTGDLKLTRSILKAASDQAADFGGEGTFEKVAETLGLIAERGEISQRELQKLFRVGVNAKKMLAEATGLQEKQISSLIAQGRIRGDVAARLISEGIEREVGGFAAARTAQTVAGRERQFAVLTELRAAEGTRNITQGYGDFLRQANAILNSSQAQQFVQFVDKTAGQLIDWTERGLKAGLSLGSGFAQGLIGGNSLTSLLGSFTKLGDWTTSALSNVFEIKSPSERMAREIGEPLGEGLGVGLVRKFRGFMQGDGVASIDRTLIETLLSQAHIQALLNTIARAEGGELNIMAGGRRVNSGAQHPGEIIPKSQWFKGDKGRSSASGLYQMTRTNWRRLAPMLGLTNFSDPRQQQMAALALMLERGGLHTLQSGDVNRMMGLAAKDWTSTPGSTIGGGGQWGRGKWLNTYQSFLGGGGASPITSASPVPVRIVTANGTFLDNLQSFTASNLANYKRGSDGAAMRDIIGGSSAELDMTVPGLQDAGEAIVNITDATRDLIPTVKTAAEITAQMVPTNALILKTLPPVLQAELELNQARANHASTAVALTKEYQDAARQELIVGMSVIDRMQGMLGQVVGMIPGQQVGKKRGLFSKILGFAAPFLSFIPGVGPILSTIAGAASNIAGGNYGAAISSIAGGFATGGVFRSSPRVTGTPTASSHPTNMPGAGLPPRAHGGPGQRGQVYWTGEYGPEPFVAPANGQFISNREAMKAMSGGGDIWERLTRALERFESMPADQVVTTGFPGILRAMDSNARNSEQMGRRLRLT